MPKSLTRQIRKIEADLEALRAQLHALELEGFLSTMSGLWEGGPYSEEAEGVLNEIQRLGEHLDSLYSEADGGA